MRAIYTTNLPLPLEHHRCRSAFIWVVQIKLQANASSDLLSQSDAVRLAPSHTPRAFLSLIGEKRWRQEEEEGRQEKEGEQVLTPAENAYSS